MRPDELPDHISDANGKITKEIIECSGCKGAYRIVPEELKFYKRLGLPLPRLCPNCRYKERIKFRNPLKWYRRECMCRGRHGANGGSTVLSGSPSKDKGQMTYSNANLPHPPHKNTEPCLNRFETSYAPDRPEIIYCEECYQHEIF